MMIIASIQGAIMRTLQVWDVLEKHESEIKTARTSMSVMVVATIAYVVYPIANKENGDATWMLANTGVHAVINYRFA